MLVSHIIVKNCIFQCYSIIFDCQSLQMRGVPGNKNIEDTCTFALNLSISDVSNLPCDINVSGNIILPFCMSSCGFLLSLEYSDNIKRGTEIYVKLEVF